jgi:hypothetical protein
MHRVLRVVVLGLVVALSVGVATATAGGGNSANAKKCQMGGWTGWVRSDGSTFNNETECVSYGAKGGTLMPKPTCTAGSENFSGDSVNSQPTTFAGGTLDTAYGFGGRVLGPVGGFTGNSLASGGLVKSFQLTFTNSVNSVQLDAESAAVSGSNTNLTLTGYDASGRILNTDTVFEPAGSTSSVVLLSIGSSSNNIKYFTIATDDSDSDAGVVFSDIAWACN